MEILSQLKLTKGSIKKPPKSQKLNDKKEFWKFDFFTIENRLIQLDSYSEDQMDQVIGYYQANMDQRPNCKIIIWFAWILLWFLMISKLWVLKSLIISDYVLTVLTNFIWIFVSAQIKAKKKFLVYAHLGLKNGILENIRILPA